MTQLTLTPDILIVEDSLTQALQLQHILSQRGFGSIMARSGEEALTLLETVRPSLVLCDIVMPGMDGYEVCARIKDNPQLENLPVILLTQLADPEDIIRGLKARADCYSTKPYNPQFLLSTIETLLQNQHAGPVENSDELEVMVSGKSYTLRADRRQMLGLLLSVYGSAVQRNKELQETQADLQTANEELADQQEKLAVVNQQLVKLATLDALTGLHNRRAFNQRLQEELNRATRQQSPLSIVMMDVDHFKSINDDFGHLIGDEVLMELAELLRETSRESDFLARYGGEEFAVLLPSADREGALQWAERMRVCVENHTWRHRPVTLSLGVTTNSLGYEPVNPSEFVDEADKALYAAKSGGRNRVAQFEPETDEG